MKLIKVKKLAIVFVLFIAFSMSSAFAAKALEVPAEQIQFPFTITYDNGSIDSFFNTSKIEVTLVFDTGLKYQGTLQKTVNPNQFSGYLKQVS